MKKILFGLMLLVMLSLAVTFPVHASIVSSVNIANAAPAIVAVTTFSSYTTRTNNTPSSAFGPGATVYIQVNVSDANEHFDITDDGFVKIKIVLLNGTTESDFARFGNNYSLNAALESGSGIYATYTASFSMTADDGQRWGNETSPLYYRVKARVSDGTVNTTSNASASQNAGYTYTNSAEPVVVASGFDGNTTDLSAVDANNITNLVLDISSTGQINFTSTINITQNIDFASYVNISHNFISVDSSALSTLNTSAVLHLRGLTFSSPTILRNGATCPSSICTLVSYANGMLIFNVTGFTNYSASEGAYCGDGSCNNGETCSSCSADCGACASSGGSSSGGGCYTTWECTDWGTCIGNAQSRSCSKAVGYCFAAVKPETSRSCTVAPVVVQPAETIVSSAVIPVVIVANETEVFLFDITLQLPKNEVSAYEKLLATVSLTNVGKAGRVSANLHYTIANALGTAIYQEDEVVPVETQMQFIKEFDVSQLVLGEYSIAVDLQYQDQKEPASSKAAFTVKPTISVTGQLFSPSDEKLIIVSAFFAAFFIVYIVFHVIKKKSFRI